MRPQVTTRAVNVSEARPELPAGRMSDLGLVEAFSAGLHPRVGPPEPPPVSDASGHARIAVETGAMANAGAYRRPGAGVQPRAAVRGAPNVPVPGGPGAPCRAGTAGRRPSAPAWIAPAATALRLELAATAGIPGLGRARTASARAVRKEHGPLARPGPLRPACGRGVYLSLASARSASARSVFSQENAVALTVLPAASE